MLEDMGGRLVGVVASVARMPVMVGEDASRPVPMDRWDVNEYCNISINELESRFGSFIAGAEAFDAAVFSISRFPFDDWTNIV